MELESEMAKDVPVSPPLIPLLPDEISILCIARVHVTSHTAIAQVSRSWRSFVRSPSFFSVRSELAVTELVLTVCIENESKIRNRWYHLHPYQTPFPLPQSEEQEHDEGFACASLGPHLFRIGGISSSHSLKIYDGCLRRWSHGPPTSTSRVYAAAGVAGGRIHVFNHDMHVLNHDDISPPALAESLDPDRTRWDPVPPIPAHLFRNCCLGSNIVDGKLMTATEEDDNLFGAAFDPDTGEWAHAPLW